LSWPGRAAWDDRDPFPPSPLDEAGDVRDDHVALVRPFDDAFLHGDGEEHAYRHRHQRRAGGPHP
jgi:hypothetical protein